MSGIDRDRSERIRALIEEVDRVCRETESVTSGVDKSLKRGSFWPDRRKSYRPSPDDHVHGGENDAA